MHVRCDAQKIKLYASALVDGSLVRKIMFQIPIIGQPHESS